MNDRRPDRDTEALLAGIVADVDADLPRLVFADFLEETGHPANVARAAFIRQQIEDDEIEGDHPERAANRLRLDDLKTQFQDEWDIAWEGRKCPVRVHRRRGFVDTILVNGENKPVLDFRETAWRYVPFTRIDLLIPFYDDAFWRRFIDHPACNRFREVNFCQKYYDVAARPFSPELVAVILRSPTLSGLRRFSIKLSEMDDLGLIRVLSLLRTAEFFDTLETLDLSHNQLTDQAAHALAAADWPPHFKLLRLGGNRLTPQGMDIVQARFHRDGKRTARVV